MKANTYKDVIELIPRRLWIYKRNDIHSDNYYCRMKFAGRRSIRKSIGYSNRQDAAFEAQKAYYEASARSSTDLPIQVRSFADVAELYMAYREAAGYKAKSANRIIKMFLIPYFSKEILHDFSYKNVTKDIKHIRQDHISGYWRWRIEYWQHKDAKKGKRDKRRKYVHAQMLKEVRYKRCSKNGPNHTTLKIEVGLLRGIFEFATKKGFIPSHDLLIINNPIPKIEGKTIKTRGTFDDEEHRELYTLIKQRKTKGYFTHYEKVHGMTKSKLEKFRCWRMWCWFFMMTATGMRPQETKKIRFGDVKKYKIIGAKEDDPNSYHTCIELSAELTKYKVGEGRKGRQVFSFDRDMTWKRVQEWRKVLEEIRGHKVKDTDLVFPQYTLPKEMGNMSRDFGALLRKHDMYISKKTGLGRSAYSLRKLYVRKRLQSGTPPHSLALNTGHSVRTLLEWYAKMSSMDIVEHLTLRTDRQARLEIVEQYGSEEI